MRTTLTLDEDVAIRLEKLRDERGDSLKSVVNDVLRRGLEALEHSNVAMRSPYRIQPHRAGRCYVENLDSVPEFQEPVLKSTTFRNQVYDFQISFNYTPVPVARTPEDGQAPVAAPPPAAGGQAAAAD